MAEDEMVKYTMTMNLDKLWETVEDGTGVLWSIKLQRVGHNLVNEQTTKYT